jgi:hypothetical protein
MDPKLSRELGVLFSNSCFFISPLDQSKLVKEFENYESESELPEHLKKHLNIARKRKKSKNVLYNTNENSIFVVKDVINQILRERGIK